MLQQQQAAQEAQGQPQDPNAAFLQAEQMKVQAKMQADAAKLQMDMAKNAQADDLKARSNGARFTCRRRQDLRRIWH